MKPRKTIRRQSGLLKVATESLAVPRSGSPAFGSPIRLEAGLAEEEEEIAAIHGEFEILVLEQQDRVGIVINNDKDKDKRKGKPKEQPDSEKQRPRNDEPGAAGVKRSKSRSALQPIDNNGKVSSLQCIVVLIPSQWKKLLIQKPSQPLKGSSCAHLPPLEIHQVPRHLSRLTVLLVGRSVLERVSIMPSPN